MDKAKKGMALVIVLIIFALIAVIGTTVLTISVSQASQTTHGISYDKAYYLARSGVEVVAKDLQERFTELAYWQSQVAAAHTVEEYTASLNEYNDKLNFINNNIIDHTVTLTNADGYVSDQVQVSNVGNIIYIESVKELEGATAKAKVNFGRHSSVSLTLTLEETTEVTVTTGDDAFYTWGNLEVMNNSEIYGNVSHTGTAEF
jgi:ABC-type Na+ efflux pump permease subunit